MTDMGLMRYFLGLEVLQTLEGIFLSQSKYAFQILERFAMKDCKPVATLVECGVSLIKASDGKPVDSTYYKSVVGCLRYLTCTRPDILFSVGLVSRFMENPTITHLKAVKRILRYVKGTYDYGLFYSAVPELVLTSYRDNDWAGDHDDRKSTTSFVYFVGSTTFSWQSEKQSIVALSSCEAEYVVAVASVCYGVWLRRLLEEMGLKQEQATEVFINNKSAIELVKNPVHHERSKHIDTRFHFLRDQVNAGSVELVYIRSEGQVVDIFTKLLKLETFLRLRQKLGVQVISTSSSLRGEHVS